MHSWLNCYANKRLNKCLNMCFIANFLFYFYTCYFISMKFKRLNENSPHFIQNLTKIGCIWHLVYIVSQPDYAQTHVNIHGSWVLFSLWGFRSHFLSACCISLELYFVQSASTCTHFLLFYSRQWLRLIKYVTLLVSFYKTMPKIFSFFFKYMKQSLKVRLDLPIKCSSCKD